MEIVTKTYQGPAFEVALIVTSRERDVTSGHAAVTITGTIMTMITAVVMMMVVVFNFVRKGDFLFRPSVSV